MSQIYFALPSPGEAVSRAINLRAFGAGTADSCTCRSFGIRGECETTLRVEELGDFCEERETVTLGLHEGGEGSKTFFALDVAGGEPDAIVASGKGFNGARSIERDGRVQGDCAGMKDVERPNVQRASGEVHTGRCSGFDAHVCELARFGAFFSRASLTEEDGLLNQ